MKFIHAADLHIDSPLWGLDAYDGAPVERLRGATRHALQNLVELALSEQVDLVLLAGDIFDREWLDFKTGLFFRQEMSRLTRANIRVFQVLGNHDAEGQISKKLPPLDGLHVFSSRKCEQVVLDHLNCVVHGRSFPNAAVDGSFVASYGPAITDKFNIGILHTSLSGNAEHAEYAPASMDQLVALGYDYYALGHIHKRAVIRDTPRIVYPGNLQGRWVGEAGSKGCELVTVEDGVIVAHDFVPLDVVRWHRLNIPVDDVADLQGLHRRFLDVAGQLATSDLERLHAVRVTLEGQTALSEIEARQPGQLAATILAAAQDLETDNLWIEKVECSVRAPLDRDTLRLRQDPVSDVIRLVDELLTNDVVMTAWIQAQLADFPKLPGKLSRRALETMNAAALRQLLADAEATVLASLSNASTEGMKS